MDCFLLVGHICTRDKDHQMSFKIHTNHLISSSCVCFMTKFSSFDTFIMIYHQTMKFVMKTMHVGHVPI